MTVESAPIAVKPARPTHYKIVCISLYTSDLVHLDASVNELKALGWTKANRSHLLRIAMQRLGPDALAEIAKQHTEGR